MTTDNKGAGGHSGLGVRISLEAADARALTLLESRIPGLIALYRFGSAANGTLRPDSDLDYAILAPAPLAPVARFEVQEDLARLLRRAVDLVDLRRASTVMRMQVIANGVAVAIRDPVETERFEVTVYASYARLNEERREILAQIAREGAVYGR